MIGQYPKGCNLRWRELLTEDEIRNWLSTGKAPTRLSKQFQCPGIYRFLFHDIDSAAIECYVGETTNLSRRIRNYFPKKNEPRWNGEISEKPTPSWDVKGRIRLSKGDFKLETLKFEDRVNFGGFDIAPESFPDPYDNFYLRRMLESWAILASEFGDRTHPLNRRYTKRPKAPL
jgi:hypothetical protein